MRSASISDVDIPKSVQEGLDHFCQQMQDAMGTQLVSVVLYGGLVKGEYVAASSDVNIMVVLNEVTVEALDKMVNPVHQGIRDFDLAVVVLSERNVGRSTDVFPIKFLDMQQYHRVVWGKDVLADLSIGRDHLRLRCEQEIKNLLLRLRRFYLHRAHHSELIESTLASAISSFLTSLSAALMLKAGSAPKRKAAIAEAAARELGLDGKPLHDVLALKSGKYKPDISELKSLYGAFMGTVQTAGDIVDSL